MSIKQIHNFVDRTEYQRINTYIRGLIEANGTNWYRRMGPEKMEAFNKTVSNRISMDLWKRPTTVSNFGYKERDKVWKYLHLFGLDEEVELWIEEFMPENIGRAFSTHLDWYTLHLGDFYLKPHDHLLEYGGGGVSMKGGNVVTGQYLDGQIPFCTTVYYAELPKVGLRQLRFFDDDPFELIPGTNEVYLPDDAVGRKPMEDYARQIGVNYQFDPNYDKVKIYEPQEGDLIIFKAETYHDAIQVVPKENSEDASIVLSVNYGWTE